MSNTTDPRADDFEFPDVITVRLRRPHRRLAGEEVLKELNFRIPSAADVKKVHARIQKTDALNGASYALFLLNVEKLTELDLDQLTAIDAELCAEAIAPFLALSARSEAGNS